MQQPLYCSRCGHRTQLGIPSGDNRERAICVDCGEIHYLNPKIVAGCILEYQGKILLCKRAIAPRIGYWTIPAGYMENGETTAMCAAREAEEEALAKACDLTLFANYSLPHISQVYMIYRGHLATPEHAPGEESLDTILVSPEEIPWDNLAFFVVGHVLEIYCTERQTGFGGCHDMVIQVDQQRHPIVTPGGIGVSSV